MVQRLKARIKDAKELGFTIRREVLDSEEATWCVLGNKKVIFLDLTQTANEQLKAAERDDRLVPCVSKSSGSDGSGSDGSGSDRSGAGSNENRQVQSSGVIRLIRLFFAELMA